MFCQKRAISHDNICHDRKHDHTGNTTGCITRNKRERERRTDFGKISLSLFFFFNLTLKPIKHLIDLSVENRKREKKRENAVLMFSQGSAAEGWIQR